MTVMPGHKGSFLEENEEELRQRVDRILEERYTSGIDGLTGDLECVVINTEPENQGGAVNELLRYTGHVLADAFEDEEARTCVLRHPASADILVRSRKRAENPFRAVNLGQKSAHVPDTRLETFVFSCADIDRYCAVQRGRGVPFMTDAPVEAEGYRFIQTMPSAYTGNSVGLIERRNEAGRYRCVRCVDMDLKPDFEGPSWKKNISVLDHVATRVKAEHRTPAILEFMRLTDYDFAFAIYVPSLNSITNVSRRRDARFALVFTSGIQTDALLEDPGPTEMFVRNYGARAHHMAFLTEDIEATDAAMRRDGLSFLSDLVGSEAGGIKQSFSAPSPNTLLVNEYIKRYNGFEGFFTEDNVTQLTLATRGQ